MKDSYLFFNPHESLINPMLFEGNDSFLKNHLNRKPINQRQRRKRNRQNPNSKFNRK